ncbi:MAG: ATP-binding protein [bacterium]
MPEQADISKNTKNSKDKKIPEGSVEFRVPSDPKILKIIRFGISHLCELAGFSQEEGKSIMLAVDEACSNIIKHTYSGAFNRPIIVSCSMLEDGVKVVLRDFGAKVNKKKLHSRDLEDIRPGGLGVHLINSVMDEVNYDEQCKDGNRLTLVRYLRQKKEDV